MEWALPWLFVLLKPALLWLVLAAAKCASMVRSNNWILFLSIGLWAELMACVAKIMPASCLPDWKSQTARMIMTGAGFVTDNFSA